MDSDGSGTVNAGELGAFVARGRRLVAKDAARVQRAEAEAVDEESSVFPGANNGNNHDDDGFDSREVNYRREERASASLDVNSERRASSAAAAAARGGGGRVNGAAGAVSSARRPSRKGACTYSGGSGGRSEGPMPPPPPPTLPMGSSPWGHLNPKQQHAAKPSKHPQFREAADSAAVAAAMRNGNHRGGTHQFYEHGSVIPTTTTTSGSLVAQREHATAFRGSLGAGMMPPPPTESAKGQHKRIAAWVKSRQQTDVMFNC